jgi:uncharacterized membrane protein YfcA
VTPGDALLIGAAGFLAGGINAVAGGGSLVSFPALVASGLPTLDANVTNSVAVWPGYIGSTLGYREELRPQRQRLLTLGITGLLGGAAGSAVLLVASESVFDNVVPVLVLAGSLLLALQPQAAELARRRGTHEHDRPSLALLVTTFVAAAYGAYFGGGLGVILLALLGTFLADDFQRLNGLKTALSLVINFAALVAYVAFAPVDWASVAVVAPAALVGGYAGSHLARRLPAATLRTAVILFGVGVSIWLGVRQWA